MLTEKTRDILVLILVAGFVLLWNLWSGSLASWDEAVYAQVSREILNSHNYLDLTWAGVRWSDKPPLYMWATVVFYKLFGVNEFAARLFSAICGLGTVIITYLLSYSLYNSRRAAFSAALILLSTWQFIWSSKVGMLDSSLTFFIALSIYLFKIGENKKIFLFFSALSFACAFLTKGGGAIIIPIIIFIYLLCSKKLRLLGEPALLWGLAAAALILGIWHIMVFSSYGKGFVEGYIVKHLFTRTTQAVEGHTGNIFTYFKVLPNKGRPWGMFLFFVVPFTLWRVFSKKESAHILPIIWALTVFAVFSAVKTKLHWYIVPIYPAASILAGWVFASILKRSTFVVMPIAALASLVYLIIARDIFNLDYNHDTKKLAMTIEDKIPNNAKIFLCDGDPAARFYFAPRRNDDWKDMKQEDIFKEPGRYALFNKRALYDIKGINYSVVAEGENFVVVRTGR